MSALTMTKIDLLLLGLLLDGPVHGYDLYQKIQAEGIDDWFNVSMAGVYYSLGKLREHDLVVESRQRGGRSARKSIYRLTEEGRATFFEVMETQATSQEKNYLDYDLVIYLLNKLPLQRAVSLLEQRQAFLAEESQRVQAALAAERENGGSLLKLAILDHNRRFLEVEQNWLADIIRMIQAEGETHDVQPGTLQGLMILSGDLRHYHLPDLIRLIASGRHSGTLTVTDGALIRTIHFEEGQPVGASCLRRDQSPARACSREELWDGLCGLFCQQEGHFTFDQRTSSQEWCVPLKLSVEDLILRGCRKVDNWAIIQRLVPSADAIFELGTASQRLLDLDLTTTEEQIVAAVDGVNDIATIARQLGLTVFEVSRAVYCLTAIGVVRTADPDKISLRRVFREIAELICNSTVAWRSTPDDRACEKEVNERCKHLPLRLRNGRIEDQTDPQLRTDELVETYGHFLRAQFEVVSHRFGRENARLSLERTLRQLAPELQVAAKHYGLDRLS